MLRLLPSFGSFFLKHDCQHTFLKMNLTECASPLFPVHEPERPTPTVPMVIVVTALPTLVTFLLWVVFVGYKPRPSFTRNMVALGQVIALVSSAAQGILVYRAFEIFACESLFPSPLSWVAVALAALALAHLLLIVVMTPRYPLTASALTLLVAASCVSGEYVGRDLIPTAAVRMLVPLQQFYCVIVVTCLVRQRSPTPSRPLPHVKETTIDPLQQRTEEPVPVETRPWSWWV